MPIQVLLIPIVVYIAKVVFIAVTSYYTLKLAIKNAIIEASEFGKLPQTDEE